MIRNLLARVRDEKSLVRGAFMLGSGAVLGQSILLAATPVLARLYSPAEIGHFAVYLSFINVAAVIAPLGFQQAIPLARNRDEASLLAVGIVAMQAVMCPLLAVGQMFLVKGHHLGFGELPMPAVYLSAVTIFAITLSSTLQFYFVRDEAYPLLGRLQVAHNGGRALFQIGFGALGAGLTGLIGGDFLGRLIAAGGGLRQAAPVMYKAVMPLKLARFREVFWRFRGFLFPQLPSIVINTIGWALPVPLLMHYYGPESAGLYAMADRLMQVPVGFISNSVGSALHGRLGHYFRTEPQLILGVFLRVSGGLLVVGVLPALVVGFWGESVFRLVLGERWAEAGRLAAHMAPLALAMLVVSTISRVVYIFQAFAAAFWYNLGAALIVAGTFWAGHHWSWPLERTVMWMARLGVVAYLCYFALLLAIVRRGARRLVAALGDAHD